MVIKITEEQYKNFLKPALIIREGIDWSKSDDGMVNLSVNHKKDERSNKSGDASVDTRVFGTKDEILYGKPETKTGKVNNKAKSLSDLYTSRKAAIQQYKNVMDYINNGRNGDIEEVDGLDAIDIRPQEFKDSFVEDDKLEDDIFMQMPTREENPTYIQGHLKNDLRVHSLGMFGISIEIQSQVKMLFEETGTINAHSDKKYDVYFIDVSYASQRIFNLIEKALPAPMILMSNFPESFNRLKYIDCASILIIKKPFEYQPEDFKKILIDYLENYNLEKFCLYQVVVLNNIHFEFYFQFQKNYLW